MKEQQHNRGIHPAFFVLITVFFFWGFVAASNGIFIPFCKNHFNLNQLESQLIDFSFYGAYFIGSLILYLLSAVRGEDILNRIGYRKGIIYGLLISVVGAILLIGAVNIGVGMENKTLAFFLILIAFFIVALGFSLQQVAANPFAVVLGNPETGSHRLNLAGGINSFGTAIGPLIISVLLFGTAAGSGSGAHTDISGVNKVYILLAVLFLAVAILFAFAKMPEVTSKEHFEKTRKASNAMLLVTAFFVLIVIGIVSSFRLPLFVLGIIGILVVLLYSNKAAQKHGDGWGAMKYPQLAMGMIAIFVYVGTEVTIQSNMGALLELPGFLTPHGLSASQIDPYISLYWGSLMIGRWAGAITAFNLKKSVRKILLVVVPFVAYAVVLLVNSLKGNDYTELLPYIPCIVIQIIGFFWGQEKPAKTLIIFGFLGIAAMLVGLLTIGKIATFAFVSGGLFCSVMWPGIFALSISGLGKYTSQGSAFLIMMILGGSLIPPVQGGLADLSFIGIHASYVIPMICFAFLAFFAYRVKGLLKSQGIDYESAISSGH
jgi:FHS family L-fucose permease-like MFS transporter